MQDAQIEIVGWACRLPGASSISGLWRLLSERRCAVTEIPADRWSKDRFWHPRAGERGRSYTFSAGILDEIWGFDADAFGLSPREAEQMDPQQRLLLELSWEALEDAGIPPSSLAGTETGVFVGASTVDNGNAQFFDMAGADPYYATGNAASVLANRISHVFDLAGPSLTIDTACSSSLVALDAAVQALRSGRVDTALVAGVNLLATPFHFIAFSQASMLSRTGLCQAFSAGADGYVRSEGGAVLVLRSVTAAPPRRSHAAILATRVNSDGRTNGIALPSQKRQAQLLETVYGQNGLDPEDLAFVEAHGTGTPAGDPIEANALGDMLGRRRSRPLPVGSIKSNIGHTEAAAGLAGVLKAALALQHDLLPASLHCETLNPRIDFDALRLHVAREAVPLSPGPRRIAGVSAYGFGGTNAHAVIADPREPAESGQTASPPSVLLLSAHTRSALAELVQGFAERVASEDVSLDLIAAANARRDVLPERLVVPLVPNGAPAQALRCLEDGMSSKAAVIGTAVARRAPVAFVYSGNGGQWAGMGRAAMRASAAFRAALDEIDQAFSALSGWSLVEALERDDLARDLWRTSVAQPLIFAIQAATTRVLKQEGFCPALVFGHSVGEVAAAEAAGLIDLGTAVRIIHVRSLHQELVAGQGGMAVLVGSRTVAEELAAAVTDLSIAAFNSSRATTLSGSHAALEQLAAAAKSHRARVQRLDLAYPFHSALIGPIEAPLLAALGDIPGDPGQTPFISTVTGQQHLGPLDAAYWWRNVREPVLFSHAVEEASRLGGRVFLEIGPNPILLAHIADTLGPDQAGFATLGVLDTSDRPGDPFRRAAAAAFSRGALMDEERLLGRDPGGAADLPSYPWQRKRLRLAPTNETTGFFGPEPSHPLIGARRSPEASEWHAVLDTALVPSLADHVVDGHVLLAGAAFAEMAVAVGRDWFGTEQTNVTEFGIHSPLMLDPPTSREVRCRIEPATGLLDIMSRPRLTQNAWQLHATGKVSRGDDGLIESVVPPDLTASDRMNAEDLYAAAVGAGLSYGPSYRLLADARRSGPDRIVVDLSPGLSDGRFWLDPAQVDACFHALVLLFDELSAGGAAKPFVPVAFAELRLLQPRAQVRRAIIEIRRKDARAILADFTLLDDQGRPVAGFKGLRFQAMTLRRQSGRAIEVFAGFAQLAAEPAAVAEEPGLTADGLVAASRDAMAQVSDHARSDDYVLMEGWATSLALALAQSVAIGGVVNPDRLARSGRLSDAVALWCGRMLAILERSGLATDLGSGAYRLLSDTDLPAPEDVLATLAAECPERASELLLAARVTALVGTLREGGSDITVAFSPSSIAAYESGGLLARRSAALVISTLERMAEDWPRDRALRIVQLGHGPLTTLAAALSQRFAAEISIVEADRRRLEGAKLALGDVGGVAFAEGFAQLSGRSFDLVIASQSLDRTFRDPGAWVGLAKVLAPGALVFAIEAAPSAFREAVFGCPAAVSAGASPLPSMSPADWRHAFRTLGLEQVVVEPAAGAVELLVCVGQASDERASQSDRGKASVVGSGEVAAAFATMLRFSGLTAQGATPGRDSEARAGLPHRIVVLSEDADLEAPAGRIASRCLALKQVVGDIGAQDTSLWIVCRGATVGTGLDPVEAAVWAFGRCLANEVPTVDVQLIDLTPGLPADFAARRLKDIVFSGTAETEIVIEAASTRVRRYQRVEFDQPIVDASSEPALRLIKGDGSGLDRVVWTTVERLPPASDEVEILVEAAGLNFRDVMWALSILPDEILEDGYAGATLGLECAGRVLRVGSDVENVRPGDPVVAFARGALATHVRVPAAFVARCPAGMPAAAAATVPVAFLTAYYALVECARLAAGEWVLIHGGAGGVGMAAIQIARWRGARVVATAGSAERRDLLMTLGAEHAFDSRTMAFAADVMRVTGTGVHVVLNSLSGEAMDRSVSVLRPFGRFVELGKRDYVANTHLGLKPFRRNLSYFGVDLDQLMLKDERIGRDMLDAVMRLFEEGVLSALPYRPFVAADAVEAFRLMQRSGHIGKIVILPPKAQVSDADRPVGPAFAIDPDRTHLVTGGLSGFGLETARWLAARGARHLVLCGRSGASRPEARDAIESFRSAGIAVHVASVDIADESAVATLFSEVSATMPPLGGVIHAATSYADAIVANLTGDKLDLVLKAKVTGAAILDRLTRSIPLDYFILYSSATTLIGNPGQGAYVAANAFLEGLAAQRRQSGLPGFAVAWGAIEDAGVLTRSSAAATSLLARSGVHGMMAKAALDRLSQLLPTINARPEIATLAVAAVNWSTAQDQLRVLRSPTFARLISAVPTETQQQGRIAIQTLIEDGGAETATRRVAEIVGEEIARILRLPVDDVNPGKPLMEMGLDSLMGVELAMALEQRFVLDTQLSQSAGAMTLRELAESLVGFKGDAISTRDQASQRLAARHVDSALRQEVIDALPNRGELGRVSVQGSLH